MTKTCPNAPSRFAVALAMEAGLFLFGLDRLAKFSTWQAQVWADFWVILPAALCIGILWPILRYGNGLSRFAAGILCLFPALMFCGVLVQVLDLFSVKPRWLDWLG